MKKKLNETAMANELRGQSLYFQETSEPTAEATDAAASIGVVEPATPPVTFLPEELQESPVAQAPAAQDALLPAGYDPVIETIRKAVKRLGKEAAFCRFTQEEKNALGDIIYTYKRGGIRTSENEVVRIAVNWLLKNYREDGQQSILAQVLDKLNA